MFLEREALAGRIAEAEFQLRCRIEAAVGEIAARLGARARGQRRLEKFGRQLHDVVQRLAPRIALPRPRCETFGSGTPASCASRSTASGKLTPSVSITKSKMLPFLPEEKSWNQAFLIVDEERRRLLLVERRQPLEFAALLASFTRRPTTSDTGSRACSSSRNWGVKRMGLAARVLARGVRVGRFSRIGRPIIGRQNETFRGGGGNQLSGAGDSGRFPSYSQARHCGTAHPGRL